MLNLEYLKISFDLVCLKKYFYIINYSNLILDKENFQHTQ